jgi:broad specificity phosphatase PhoE
LKKLTFFRHFRTRIEKDKPASEWNLDETGVEEMREMIDSGAFEGFDRVISSAESKAMVTAKAISERHGIPVTVSYDIVEVDRDRAGFIEGDYEMAAEKYLSETDDFDQPWEDISSVRTRALRFMNQLEDETGNLLVISHGLFLSVLLSGYFGQPPAGFWRSLTFGQLLEVDYEELNSSLSDQLDA